MQHGGPEHGDALLRHAHNAEPDTEPDDSGADSPWCHTRTDAYAHLEPDAFVSAQLDEFGADIPWCRTRSFCRLRPRCMDSLECVLAKL